MKISLQSVSGDEFCRAEAVSAAEEALTESTKKLLQNAAAQKCSVFSLRSVLPGEKPSDTFRKASEMLRAIVDHGKENPFPETVEILCDSETTADLYRKAYNWWFAGTKDERL